MFLLHEAHYNLVVYDKATFSQLHGHPAVAIAILVLYTDHVDCLTGFFVLVRLVQCLKGVIVGASGDSCELQKTI